MTTSRQSLPKIKRFSDEWAVLQFLKRWTSQDIRRAIDEDVDLADLLLQNRAVISLLRTIAKRNRNILDFLSPENILCWFSYRRPDMYVEIMKDKRGPDFLNRNFDKVRNILFNQ